MNWNELLQAWTDASLKIMDIRRRTLEDGEALYGYRLPANAYLFAVRGCARVGLNDRFHSIDGFHILHGAKGNILSVPYVKERLDYYLLFYKASLTLGGDNPLHAPFGFAPPDPLPLLEIVRALEAVWLQQGRWEKLQAKALFYQWISEQFRQFRELEARTDPGDLAAQAIELLHERYPEPLTLESLAERLNCSPGHLSRTFRSRTGTSPIDYLIRIRIDRARTLLSTTELSLQQIAAGVGYADVYYFGRLFKKQLGISPIRYRARTAQTGREDGYGSGSEREFGSGFQPGAGSDTGSGSAQHSPSYRSRSSIVPGLVRRYSIHDNDNYYQYKREGVSSMNSRTTRSTALSLLLCLTLLLAACSGGNTNATPGASPVGSAATQPAGSAEPAPSSAAVGGTTIYEAANGSIEVPRNPQRIVVLTHAYVGHFLLLGIKPIGVPTITMDNPYLQTQLDGVEDVGSWGAFSTEKIVSLNPDLIVALNTMENIEEIAKIAPTVGIQYGEYNYKEQLIEFGKLTNREDKAREWVAAWEQKIAEFKPQVLEAVGDSTVSVMSATDKSVYLYGYGFGRGTEILYDEFGLKSPPGFDLADSSAEISLEQVPELAGDYIFISNDISVESGDSPIFSSEVWKSLPAVKNNRVFEMDQKAAAFNDPYTLEAMLPFVVDSLLSKP